MTTPPFSRPDQERTDKPPVRASAAPTARRAVFGTGEMADRIRAFPWAATPLGPIASWPETLLCSVNSMLESRFPTSILWGSQMLHLYNDAYLPLSADKHPVLLGQPAAEQWAEAWHIIGPQFASVLDNGATVFEENVLVPVLRAGVLQDVYWTYSYSPLRSSTGEIEGILVVCHDVTGQLRATRQRDAIATHLESVLGSITDGLSVFDTDWRYTYINEQGARLVGQRSQDLIGVNLWELFPEAVDTAFYQSFHRAVATGRPVHLEEFYPAPLNKWLECHCYPSAQGLSVYFRDISDRKQNEQALARSEERFRTLLELAPVGVAISDAETGQLQFANERMAEITGYSVAELTHMRSANLTHPDDLDQNSELYRRIAKGLDAAGVVVKRYLRKDGEVIWVRVTLRIIEDRVHHRSQILGTIEDVTESLQAQKATEESETRLAALADTIPTLAWMANGDGSIFWYNRRWYEYTGTTPEQMEGWGWQSVHHPAVLPSVLERWTECIRTGSPFEMVFPLRGADGVFRSFITRVLPVKSAAGEVTRWFGTNTEVDELERTRSELAEERSRLNAVLENVPVGLVFSDITGRLVGGNAFAERIFRHPVLLSPSLEQYEQYVSYHPDGSLVLPHEYPLARTLADGAIHSREFLYQRGDGTRAWVNFTSAPIRDSHGAVIGAVVATLDIDERKRAQDELREKNELVELAQTAARAGFWQYYPETGTCLLSFGSQSLFDLQGLERVPLETVVERIHPEDRERVRLDLAAALDSGFYQSSFRITSRDQDVCWISGQARLFRNARGESYFAGFNLDITTQKRAEEALRKSEKLAVAGRLAATISHEINNPLESVTNLLYIIRTGTGEEQTRTHAIIAEEELNRVTQIVTQSLRFHRSSTAPTFEKLSTVLDSAAALYKSRLLTGSLEIRRRYRDRYLVCSYTSELRQVFGNLVGNALDAIRSSGVIHLRTRDATDPLTAQPGVRVTVADTGHGMDAHTLKRIAEPFFTTKGINGTGLGLWISRDILQKHNATLRIRSRTTPGHSGTVFSIFVPLNQSLPAPDDHAPDDPAALPH